MKEIIVITKGLVYFVKVDDEDYDYFDGYKWHITKNGYVRRGSSITKDGIKIKFTEMIHREILNAQQGQIVDHINGDKLDNRKENLRFVTREQSNQNRKVSSLSHTGYKGVSLKSDHHKRTRPYEVQISVNGETIWIASCETAIEAALEYDDMALIYHGEYARLNFPEE